MASDAFRRFANAEALSQQAAAALVALAQERIAATGRFVLALSGGSTPRRLYEVLATPAHAGKVDWKRVEFFWGDERAVPPDHEQSNFRMAKLAFFDRVPEAASQARRMRGEASDLDAAAREYEAEIARAFGTTIANPPPAFDLVLLGMGPDGHTASLFPHTKALAETKRWVVANDVPQLQTKRMTMTPALLNAAANVWFLIAGADKTDRLAEVMTGPRDLDRLPIQRIHPAGQATWWLDEAAAAKLP